MKKEVMSSAGGRTSCGVIERTENIESYFWT